MLSPIEITLIFLFVSVFSIVEVLSARFYLRDFPWRELIFKSHFFGGADFLKKRLVMLARWVSLSIVFSLLFAAIVKYLILLVVANIEFSASGSFPYFIAALPTLFSIAFFIVLCELLRAYLRKQRNYDVAEGQVKKIGHSYVERGKGKFKLADIFSPNGVVATVGFLPKALLDLYRYFYLEAETLLIGASNALVSQYGAEMIVRFFESQKALSPSLAVRGTLHHLDASYENSLDWAQYLLMANIRAKGLHEVKRALKGYIQVRKSAAVSKREAERIRCKKPLPVLIRSKGLVGYAKLLEYSVGYRGFYITTNLNIDQRERISITINNTEYTAKVVHQNSFIIKERIFSGYGLSLAS